MTKNITASALLPLNAHLDALTPDAYTEASDEFNGFVPEWEARLAAFDAREAGLTLYASDLDDYLAPTADFDRAIRDWDAYIAMCYVDPAERDF